MKDHKKIIVTVAGCVGTGKSTIIKVITDALAAAGLVFKSMDFKSDDGFHEKRLDAMTRHGIHITVKAKQRRRVLK